MRADLWYMYFGNKAFTCLMIKRISIVLTQSIHVHALQSILNMLWVNVAWGSSQPGSQPLVMTRSLFLSQDPIRTISLSHDTEIEMYSHNFSSNIWPHLSVKIWFGYIHHFLWVRQWPWWTNHLICIELLLIIDTCKRKWWSSLCFRHLEILDSILMMHICYGLDCVDPTRLKFIKTTIIVNWTEVPRYVSNYTQATSFKVYLLSTILF